MPIPIHRYLLKPGKRGYQFVRRIVFLGLNKLYVCFFVIPYLRSRGNLSKLFSELFRTPIATGQSDGFTMQLNL